MRFRPATGLFWSRYFCGIARSEGQENSEFGWVASGGRCQWVLDATCHVVEWLGQPLRFESVVLRTALGPLTRVLQLMLIGGVPTGSPVSPA
jgi:hypothetical protein